MPARQMTVTLGILGNLLGHRLAYVMTAEGATDRAGAYGSGISDDHGRNTGMGLH